MAEDRQTRIDRLESLLSRGVLEIKEGSSSTTFQNAGELRKEIARLKAEEAAALNGGGGSRTSYASFED